MSDRKCKHCGVNMPQDKRGRVCYVCKNGLNRYNLNRIQQETLLAEQHGKCKLCNADVALFAGRSGGFIDHDHATGKVRGILCLQCNTAVGYIESKLEMVALNNYLA